MLESHNMRGMSTLSSDRLNLARKDHKVVARAQLFREHSRTVHHVLITVASSSSKFELLKYGKAHCKIPPTVRSMQSSDLYRSKISNQPTFKGKCVRPMEKERWVTVWFDDGVGNLKVVEITCTTTNAVVTPASWLPISYSRLRWKSMKTDASRSRIRPNFSRMCLGKLCTGLWLKICIFGNYVTDAEEETTINNLLQQQAVDFFDTSTQKLVMRYNKCLDSASDYVEK